MTTMTNLKAYYLVDSSGDTRYVFGPYQSYETAVKAAGRTALVMTGAALAGRKTITRAALSVLVQAGAVRPASPHVDAANI